MQYQHVILLLLLLLLLLPKKNEKNQILIYANLKCLINLIIINLKRGMKNKGEKIKN